MSRSRSFREILLGALDHGLMILRAGVRQAVCDHLERSHAIEREEVSVKLMLSHEALIPMIGAGGNVADRVMARSLYGQLGPDFSQHQECVLVDYVGHALKSGMITPTYNRSSEVNSDA